jgi:hypothetical protein
MVTSSSTKRWVLHKLASHPTAKFFSLDKKKDRKENDTETALRQRKNLTKTVLKRKRKGTQKYTVAREFVKSLS